MKRDTSIRLNRAYDRFKEILLMLLIGLFCAVTATIITWLTDSGGTSDYERIGYFVLVFVLCFILAGFFKLSKRIYFKMKLNDVLSVCEEDGYTDKFFILFNQLIEEEKNYNNKLKLHFIYARELSDGERYDDSCKVIRDIHAVSVGDNKLNCAFFSLLLYNLIISEKIDEADALIEKNDKYINYARGKSIGALLNIAIGLNEYVKGKYSDALRSFELAFIASSKNSWEATQSKLYMCLIYLKQDMKDMAQITIEDLKVLPMTHRQSEDFDTIINM